MAPRTMDPKAVIIIVGGIPMSGFADGTFVKVSRNNDSFAPVDGADGFTSRAKSNSKSGTIVLTLAQTSPSNDVLSRFHMLDELSNTGVVPVSVTDLRGTTICKSPAAWVRKPADAEYGKEITDREWTIDCTDLEMKVGGNV